MTKLITAGGALFISFVKGRKRKDGAEYQDGKDKFFNLFCDVPPQKEESRWFGAGVLTEGLKTSSLNLII